MADRTALEETEANSRMCAPCPSGCMLPRRMCSACRSRSDVFPDTEQLVRGLKTAGHPVYLLSNASLFYKRHAAEHVSAAAMMGGRLFSCYVGRLKPLLQIYCAFAERLTNAVLWMTAF